MPENPNLRVMPKVPTHRLVAAVLTFNRKAHPAKLAVIHKELERRRAEERTERRAA